MKGGEILRQVIIGRVATTALASRALRTPNFLIPYHRATTALVATKDGSTGGDSQTTNVPSGDKFREVTANRAAEQNKSKLLENPTDSGSERLKEYIDETSREIDRLRVIK